MSVIPEATRPLPARQPTAVDIHAHTIVPGVDDFVASRDPQGARALAELELRRQGPASAAVSRAMIIERLPRLIGLGDRLERMDAMGVSHQLVSPSPSHYYPFAAEDLSLEASRRVNEGVRDVVAQAPDRLRGLGVGPLQHPRILSEVLEHAVVDCGLAGVVISSTGPDGDRTVELSDERLDPFWTRAEELGAVIFLHPFGCSLDIRLDRYYLSNVVGQPVENAVALSHLIFGGVLDRHPRLRLLAAHGGGYLPTFLGRGDHAWMTRADSRSCLDLPSSYLSRLYFDSLVYRPDALESLVAVAGADRVLLGSDYPFDMGVEDPAERVALASLAAEDREAILFGNAVTLGLVP